MATAIGTARNVAAAQLKLSRPLQQTGQEESVRCSIFVPLRRNRQVMIGRSPKVLERRSRSSGFFVRAELVRSEGSAAGDTASLRDVATGSEGEVADLAALRDIASEEEAEGGFTPELHKTARDKAEHSSMHESVQDLEIKASEVASAEAEKLSEGLDTVDNGRWDLREEETTDDAELPTVQELCAEIVEAMKETIEELKWNAEDVITSVGSQEGFELLKEAIGKRFKAFSLAAKEVREVGAQSAEIATKGWGELSAKAEGVQKEVSILAEELQSWSDRSSGRAADGWKKSRSQILQALELAQKQVQAVAGMVTETAWLTGEGARNRGVELGESAQKSLTDFQEKGTNLTEKAVQIGQEADTQTQRMEEEVQKQAKQVADAVGDAALIAENRGMSGSKQDSFGESLQSQDDKVSAFTGRVVQESQDLWKNLTNPFKRSNSDDNDENYELDIMAPITIADQEEHEND